MSFFNNILNIFSSNSSVKSVVNVTNRNVYRPSYSDLTCKVVVNKEITYGLYFNQLEGFKLSGSLTRKPIDLPISFMGIPSFSCANEDKKNEVDRIISERIEYIKSIFKESHREGTIWVYPRYDKQYNVIWEFIEDEKMQDIVRDLDSKEIKALYSYERLSITTGQNTTQEVERNREWTQKYISEKYSNALPGVYNKKGLNPFGIMPIPFTNNKDLNEIRGHSDYANIVTDLKIYHDTKLEMHRILTKFKPKLIQTGKSFNTWVKNNLNGSVNNLDIDSLDLVFNTIYDDGTKEETKIETSINQITGHIEALKNLFLCIVEGSGIHEIFWGSAVSGNHASSSEQMESFVKFISSKRNQHNDSLEKLIDATYKLEMSKQIGGKISEDRIITEWGSLSALSQKAQGEVFQMFASSASTLMNSGSITTEQLYKIWKDINPGATNMNLEDFQAGLKRE